MSATLKFLGRGGAFAPLSIGNSNMLLTTPTGKKMLIDFGQTGPYILRDEWGIDFREIDALWISHLHADHIGGLEQFAFSRYFQPKKDDKGVIHRPKLFMMRDLMQEMWETSLKGGLESLEGKVMTITDYFCTKPIERNHPFVWEGIKFTPVQTVHIRSGRAIKNSFGLELRNAKHYHNNSCFITTDTQFDQSLSNSYGCDIIFHDCETLPFKSGVHAHYSDLKTLPGSIKQKMWLYHYKDPAPSFVDDGFAGFVEKGQEFQIL